MFQFCLSGRVRSRIFAVARRHAGSSVHKSAAVLPAAALAAPASASSAPVLGSYRTVPHYSFSASVSSSRPDFESRRLYTSSRPLRSSERDPAPPASVSLDEALADFDLDAAADSIANTPTMAAAAAERLAARRLEHRLSRYDDSFAAEYADELASSELSPAQAVARAHAVSAASAAAAAGPGGATSGLGAVGRTATVSLPDLGLAADSPAATAPGNATAPEPSAPTAVAFVAPGPAAVGSSADSAEDVFGMSSLGNYAVTFPDPLVYTGTENVSWLPASSVTNPFAFPVLDVSSLCIEPDEVIELAQKHEQLAAQPPETGAGTGTNSGSSVLPLTPQAQSLKSAYADFSEISASMTSDGGLLGKHPQAATGPNAVPTPGGVAAQQQQQQQQQHMMSPGPVGSGGPAGFDPTTLAVDENGQPRNPGSPNSPGTGSQFRQSLVTFPRPLLVRFPVTRALRADIESVFTAPMPRTAEAAVDEEERRARAAGAGAPLEVASVARFLQSASGTGADLALEDVKVKPRVVLPPNAKQQQKSQKNSNKQGLRSNGGTSGGGAKQSAVDADAERKKDAARAPPVRVAQRAALSGGRFDVYLAGLRGSTLFFSSRAGVAAKGELLVTAAAIERHHIVGLKRPAELVPLPKPLAQAEMEAVRARGGVPGRDPAEVCGVLELEVGYVTTTYSLNDPFGEPSSNIAFRAREVDFLLRSVIFGVHLPAPVPPQFAHAVEAELEAGAGALVAVDAAEARRRRALTGRLCMALYGQGANVVSTVSPLLHPVVAPEELLSVELAVLYGDPRTLFPPNSARVATEEELKEVISGLSEEKEKAMVRTTDAAGNVPKL